MGAYGKSMWVKLTEVLADTLHDVDQYALEAICGHYDSMIRAQKDLSERGPIVDGRDGERVKNPSAQIARDSSASFKAWTAEFGLTPKARKTLAMTLGETEEDSGDLIG